jgi:sugar/nucleoside kinase (ribokinase family)
MRYDLIVAGHIVLDYIRRGGEIHGPYLGGPSVYTGIAARALDASVSIASKVGTDFGDKRMAWLRAHGLSLRQIEVTGSDTTSFQLDYKDNRRRLEVRSVCEPMHISDIAKWSCSRAVHLGPVLREINPSEVLRLAKRDVVLSLDPQGYCRQVRPNGSVRMKAWHDRSLLKKVAVLRLSEEESPLIGGSGNSIQKLSRLGPQIILLTKGKKGTTVWSEDECALHVPAYPTVVRDPTGAGDALVGPS